MSRPVFKKFMKEKDSMDLTLDQKSFLNDMEALLEEKPQIDVKGAYAELANTHVIAYDKLNELIGVYEGWVFGDTRLADFHSKKLEANDLSSTDKAVIWAVAEIAKADQITARKAFEKLHVRFTATNNDSSLRNCFNYSFSAQDVYLLHNSYSNYLAADSVIMPHDAKKAAAQDDADAPAPTEAVA